MTGISFLTISQMNLSKQQAKEVMDAMPAIARAGIINPLVFRGVWLKEVDGVIFWKTPQDTQWNNIDELQRLAN